MSYHIEIVRPVYHKNYTSNVYEMYRRAFKNEDGIRVLDGMYVGDAEELLDDAIKYFKENKEELEKLNPENGWGSYKGALNVLVDLSTECSNECLDNGEDSFVTIS